MPQVLLVYAALRFVLRAIQVRCSTHFLGKWDAGMATPEHTPLGRGFNTFLVTLKDKPLSSRELLSIAGGIEATQSAHIVATGRPSHQRLGVLERAGNKPRVWTSKCAADLRQGRTMAVQNGGFMGPLLKWTASTTH